MQSFIDSIKSAIESAILSIRTSFLDSVITWFYEKITEGCQSLFSSMTNIGTQLFELEWVKAALGFFNMFGWMMFISGCVVAIFSIAITYMDTGVLSFKRHILPIIEGLVATSLFTIVPVALYKASANLQSTFISDLSDTFLGADLSIATAANNVIDAIAKFYSDRPIIALVFVLIIIICIVKVFLENIKRGGIMLIQMAVGSLHMFSIPRGFTDGFNSWCKQVIALCFTAFLQTTLLYMGLITFLQYPLVGLGVVLSAYDVAKITKMFGLDTSVSISPAINKANSVIHLGRNISR